jgi:protease I
MKAIIITWENFQDHELIYPYYRLKEETNNVIILSNKLGKFNGIMGTSMISNYTVDILHDKKECNNFIEDYNILVLPGGVKAMEKLRQEKQVINFISNWNNKNKIIACICSGTQLLISAKIVKGRKVSGYYSMEDDIINAGANYSRDSVVVDKNLITSPHYDFMGIWMKTAIIICKTNNFMTAHVI